MTARKLLKPSEVADRLAVSRSWVYDAAAAGRLPSVRLGSPDGPLRFVEKDLEDWLATAKAAWKPGARGSTASSGTSKRRR